MNKYRQEQIYGISVLIFWILFAIFVEEKSARFSKGLFIQQYGQGFSLAALLSFIFIGVNFYQKSIIDRLVLGITLFWSIGTIVYFANIPLITRYYDDYASLTFFLSLLIVGIFTTLFSPAGFIGELSASEEAVKKYSLKMLVFTFIAMSVSFFGLYLGWPRFCYFSIPAFTLINLYVLNERKIVNKW